MTRSYAKDNLHIFQSGLPKSGNLFLYKIMKHSIWESDITYKSFILNHPVRDYIMSLPDRDHDEQGNIDGMTADVYGYQYGIPPMFLERVYDLKEYISKCTLMWSHDGISAQLLAALGRFNKIVYIIRDPRDVLISWARWCFTPFCLRYYPESLYGAHYPTDFIVRNLERIVLMWVHHVAGFLRFKDKVHIVFFERLVHDFDREFNSLLDYLEISLSEESKGKVKEATDYEKMKKTNQHHLKSGTSGQWRAVLNEKLQKKAIALAGPLLERLNYTSSFGDDTFRLPVIPEKFTRFDYYSIARPLRKHKLWIELSSPIVTSTFSLRA